MFFRKLKEQRKMNTKLRTKCMTLTAEKDILEKTYKDKLKELHRDKKIQEFNNTKLITENLMYKKVIEKLENAKTEKEMKKILADLRVQLISFYKN